MDEQARSRVRNYWREGLLIVIIGISLIGVMVQEPIPQDPLYHDFADNRMFWGVPNFFNTTTNIAFLVVGLIGLIFCWNSRQTEAPWSWAVLFSGVALVCVGSAYYHTIPNNQTLVWDRLPMTVAFMGLFVALLSEYVSEKLERTLLIPAVVLGVLSVVYWHYTDDLRIYVWVQAIPLLCIPIVIITFKGRYTHQSYLLYGLLFYALAKVAEFYDKEIFWWTQQSFSGHSLKHLLAALAPFIVYLMLRRRRRREVSPAGRTIPEMPLEAGKRGG